MDRCKWRKMIKEARWSRWVWVGECSFWYRPTRVVPDQRPLNGRCCCWVLLHAVGLHILFSHQNHHLEGMIHRAHKDTDPRNNWQQWWTSNVLPSYLFERLVFNFYYLDSLQFFPPQNLQPITPLAKWQQQADFISNKGIGWHFLSSPIHMPHSNLCLLFVCLQEAYSWHNVMTCTS